MNPTVLLAVLALLTRPGPARAEVSPAPMFENKDAPKTVASPLAEKWDYAAPMRKVAARFKGNEGVVIHVGASDTIANPYTTWARQGKGTTAEEEAVLTWMHTNKND